MKRICLIPCPISSTEETVSDITKVSIPLGVLSLYAQIESNPTCGYVPDFCDLNLEIERRRLNLDREFYDTAAQLLADRNSDIYGFGTISNTYIDVLEISKRLKNLRPEVDIIFGGAQASITDVRTLEVCPFVDIVVRGEAEYSLLELLGTMRDGGDFEAVGGITWRDRTGAIVRNAPAPLIEDLDELPLPKYELYSEIIKSYSGTRESNMEFVNGIPIDVGRGCPFSCTFCVTNDYFVRAFRLKSQDRILEEVRYLSEHFGATLFHFEHDMFTVNRKKVMQFCKRLAEEKMDISWNCSARVDTVDEELLGAMAAVGCKTIFFGLESASQKVQKSIKKNLKLKSMNSTLDLVREAGIEPILSFIIGFPDEDRQDLQATMDFFLKQAFSNTIANIGILVPSPGTPITIEHSDKLNFDLFYSEATAPLVHEQDVGFMAQHPDLFSDCFYIETEIERDLHKFVLLIVDQLQDFRWSIWTLAADLSIPFALFDLWKIWHAGSLPSSRWYLRGDEVTDTFSRFLKSSLVRESIRAPWYGDVLEYEERMVRLRNSIREPVAAGAPKDDKGSTMLTLDFNMLKLFGTFKDNLGSSPADLRVDKEPTTHLIVEDGPQLTVLSFPSFGKGAA